MRRSLPIINTNNDTDKAGLGIGLLALGIIFSFFVPEHIKHVPTNMHHVGYAFFVLGAITMLYAMWTIWMFTHQRQRNDINNNSRPGANVTSID